MDRIVIVTKPTRLEELVLEHLTLGAAQFILESRKQSIEPYQREDAAYKTALSELQRQMPNDIPLANVSREDLPNFLFRDKDLIVVCGPDGLFANLAKYVGNQQVLTVNPDPQTIDGVLMLFAPKEVGGIITAIQEGTERSEKLPFLKATIDDDKVIWGVNDIFIGRKDHVSARYEIDFNGTKEHQSSSGIVVSTGLGSSGWMQSFAAMLDAIGNSPGDHKLEDLPQRTSNELVFVVREPFPSKTTGASIVTGRITPDTIFAVNSEMSDGGCIFSDGVTEKAVEWNSGSRVEISIGERYIERIVR